MAGATLCPGSGPPRILGVVPLQAPHFTSRLLVSKHDIGPPTPPSPPPLDQVVSFTYQELRAIAHRRLTARAQGGTLSTTALVHEAYLKLADHSRGAVARRRAFPRPRVAWRCGTCWWTGRESGRRSSAGASAAGSPSTRTCSRSRTSRTRCSQLDEALERLAEREPRLAQVVECRFFGGLTEQETADALGLTDPHGPARLGEGPRAAPARSSSPDRRARSPHAGFRTAGRLVRARLAGRRDCSTRRRSCGPPE